MILKNKKIYVAGHKGLVGSAVVRRLRAQGFKNILTGIVYILQYLNNPFLIQNHFSNRDKNLYIWIYYKKMKRKIS